MNLFLLILIIAFLLNHFAKGEYNKEKFSTKLKKTNIYSYIARLKIEIIIIPDNENLENQKKWDDFLKNLYYNNRIIFDKKLQSRYNIYEIIVIDRDSDAMEAEINKKVKSIFGGQMDGIVLYNLHY